jgi:hypothetical protein
MDSLFAFIVGLLIGFVLGWVNKKSKLPDPSPFFACPFCSEPLRTGSVVCNHCHRDLASSKA